MARKKKAARPEADKESSGVVGLVVCLLLWISLGLMPLLFGWSDVRLAFGLSGQPGTVTVEKCVHYGSGKSAGTDCRGLFTPDDPVLPPRRVQLPPESHEGETFSARLDPGKGWAHPDDTAGRLASLALPALGVLILVPLPTGLFFLLVGRSPGRVAVALTAVPAAAAVVLCAVGLVAAG